MPEPHAPCSRVAPDAAQQRERRLDATGADWVFGWLSQTSPHLFKDGLDRCVADDPLGSTAEFCGAVGKQKHMVIGSRCGHGGSSGLHSQMKAAARRLDIAEFGLREPVSQPRSSRRGMVRDQGGVLGEHPGVQVKKLRPGIDAQAVAKRDASAGESTQSLTLPPGAVVRPHQQRPQRLT